MTNTKCNVEINGHSSPLNKLQDLVRINRIQIKGLDKSVSYW
jgi:hypothetical protein